MKPRRLAIGRSGILLPVALLYLLILAGLGGTALVLGRVEREIAWEDVRWLGRELALEGALSGSLQGTGVTEIALGGGFLLRRGVGADASQLHSPSLLLWAVDAESVDPGVEAGWGSGEQLILGGAECGPVPSPIFRIRPPASGSPPDPPLAPSPRLGPLSIEQVAERADLRIVAGSNLLPGSGSGEPSILSAAPGAILTSGRFVGVILAEGDLILEKSAEVTGLLLVRGDLELRNSARVLGSVRVGGRIVRMK